MAQVRKASHAYSWYEGDGKALGRELTQYLEAAQRNGGERPRGQLKALISPHAGYRHCGPTGAYGFGSINPAHVERVFVLGPSHHVYLRAAALPRRDVGTYATPFGALQLDQAVLEELRAKAPSLFDEFGLRDDEAEHSVEMQLPFLAMVMQGTPFTLVPIVVGSMQAGAERQLGQILAPYFQDPRTLFIISSDFCHWGQRFNYTHLRSTESANCRCLVHDAKRLPINAGIELLDRAGMDIIETQDVDSFRAYLDAEQNTICGQHPICVLLETLRAGQAQTTLRFIHYSQSSEMPAGPSRDDSCVSYASAVVVA